jgi:hypothetical protein
MFWFKDRNEKYSGEKLEMFCVLLYMFWCSQKMFWLDAGNGLVLVKQTLFWVDIKKCSILVQLIFWCNQ